MMNESMVLQKATMHFVFSFTVHINYILLTACFAAIEEISGELLDACLHIW